MMQVNNEDVIRRVYSWGVDAIIGEVEYNYYYELFLARISSVYNKLLGSGYIEKILNFVRLASIYRFALFSRIWLMFHCGLLRRASFTFF